MMLQWIALWVVPMLAVVVLGALLATSGNGRQSLFHRTLGVVGVLFVGPAVMLLLGSAAAQAADATKGPDSSNVLEKSLIQNSSPPAKNQPTDSKSASDIKIADPQAPLVTYPSDRPTWVNSQPQQEAALTRYFVSSGEQVSHKESLAKLDLALVDATNAYIDEVLGNSDAAKYFQYDLKFIKAKLLDSDPQFRYGGIVRHEWGNMYEQHRALLFDESFRNTLQSRWEDLKTRSRLLYVAVGAVGMLGLLGAIFSYFRLDNATRGFYTGRLQFAAVGTILAIIAVGVLLARWIPWV